MTQPAMNVPAPPSPRLRTTQLGISMSAVGHAIDAGRLGEIFLIRLAFLSRLWHLGIG